MVAAWPIPGKCRVNGFWVEQSLVGKGEEDADTVPVWTSYMYGVNAYVVPVPDPDSATNPDTLWDQMIPKDTEVHDDILDIDTAYADTTPVFELGELDLTDYVEVTTAPVELFSRRKMLTFANSPLGQHVATDAFYRPTDHWKTHSKKGAWVKYPSYFLLGNSQPSYVHDKGYYPQLETKAEWAQIQYLEYTLEEAWKDIVGLVSSGTQETAVEAAMLLQNYMEAYYEEDSHSWGGNEACEFYLYTKTTLDVTVPGSLGTAQLGNSL